MVHCEAIGTAQRIQLRSESAKIGEELIINKYITLQKLRKHQVMRHERHLVVVNPF